MSKAEAIVELQRFVDSKDSDHPLYAHFRQDNPKKGHTHEATYEKYKSVVTVDDYLSTRTTDRVSAVRGLPSSGSAHDGRHSRDR